MATPDEEVNFEHWMLSDINLCKDIAEFAQFAIALRGGLPEGEADDDLDAGGGRGRGAAAGLAVGGVAVVGIGLVVLVVIAAIVVGLVFM